MASSTLNRTSLTPTNDTGSASSPNGDGTVLNAAYFTLLMDRIDALHSGALTVGGVLSSEGFGTHSFSTGGTGGNLVNVRNTTAGTGNYSGFYAGNNSAARVLEMYALSSTFTSTATDVASGASVISSGSGGLTVGATHAAGVMRVVSGSSVRATWGVSGELTHNSGLYLSGAFNQSVTGNTELSGSAATTVLCRITSASSSPVITGANGAAGQVLLIKNVSGSAVTLAHQSTSSSPTLRFVCPGNANVGIDDGDGVIAIYNTTDSRWYVFGI